MHSQRLNALLRNILFCLGVDNNIFAKKCALGGPVETPGFKASNILNSGPASHKRCNNK